MNKKYLIGMSAFRDPDLLEKTVNSLPKDVDHIIFFDGKYWKDIFGDFLKKYNGYYDSYNEHLGCSGSWNCLMRTAFHHCNLYNYDALTIIGTDIKMKEGYYEDYIKEFEEQECEFATARGFGFNCFTLTRKCFEVVGLMDENIFPAYYEDNDYHTRVRISGLKNGDIGNPDLFEHYGSAVIRKNNKCQLANNATFPMNQKYYTTKWGITDVTKIEEYKFLTPFNDPTKTIKDWELDEEMREIKRKIWEQCQRGF